MTSYTIFYRSKKKKNRFLQIGYYILINIVFFHSIHWNKPVKMGRYDFFVDTIDQFLLIVDV